MDAPSFENIIWRCMAGSQAALTIGTDRVRRYVPGFTRIVAFADPKAPDLEAIAPHCGLDERFYCSEWDGPVPAGWRLDVEGRMLCMLWRGADPVGDASLGAVQLDARHVPAMQALAQLTRPGPFDDRTIEFGEWFGVFDGERLIAMAGERMHCEPLREVSGICTHPDAQGRGLARRLTELVIGRQLARGQVPFLHVMAANTRAVDLYRRMGFTIERDVPVRVIGRVAI